MRYAGKKGRLIYNGVTLLEISDCTLEMSATNEATYGFGYDFPQRTPIHLDWKCDVDKYMASTTAGTLLGAIYNGYRSSTGLVLTVYEPDGNYAQPIITGPVRPATGSATMSDGSVGKGKISFEADGPPTYIEGATLSINA